MVEAMDTMPFVDEPLRRAIVERAQMKHSEVCYLEELAQEGKTKMVEVPSTGANVSYLSDAELLAYSKPTESVGSEESRRDHSSRTLPLPQGLPGGHLGEEQQGSVMPPRMGSMGKTEQIPQVLPERHPGVESCYDAFSSMESAGRLSLARTQVLPSGTLAEKSGGMGLSSGGMVRTQELPRCSLAGNSGRTGPSGDGLVNEIPGSGPFGTSPENTQSGWSWSELEAQLDGIADEELLAAGAHANGYRYGEVDTILVMEEQPPGSTDLPSSSLRQMTR
jgi:hypothetical protein